VTRILHLHQFDLDLAGGSGVYLRALRRALLADGHEVAVVSARLPDRYGCTTAALPFDHVYTYGPEKRPGERAFAECTGVELERLADRSADIASEVLHDRGADLVLVNHLGPLAVAAARLHAATGVPYRVIAYGTDTELLAREPRMVPAVRAAAAGAEQVFAISRFVGDQVAVLLGLTDVAVLGGAVDADVFHPGPPPSKDQVLFGGRLVTEKGIDVLLDAMEQLDERTHLTIAGEGPRRDDIAARIAHRPLRGRATMLGFASPAQLAERMRSATVFAVPSTWQEPLGLVVLEALACGLPVVASDVGGIGEMVRAGVNGLLVPPGDADALAGALRAIVDDPYEQARLRRNCLTGTHIPTYDELARLVIADVPTEVATWP
jgi:glycosyltransferase involved in cell wall biosynthesis